MKIIEAIPGDAEELTQLTLRSKAYWGYPPEQMKVWRHELTISSEFIKQYGAFKLIKDDRLAGFYAFRPEQEHKVKLEFLFIDVPYMQMGLGSLLLEDFITRVSQLGYEGVILDADPNAESFYFKHGFRVTGQLPSSIPERFLPVMELSLK